jgi:hypothetical protein
MALDGSEYRVRTSYNVTNYAKPFQNVWYFVRTVGADIAEALRDGFINDFVPIIESLLPDYVDTAIDVIVENLLDLDDFAIGTTPLQGTFLSTQGSPSFECAAFQIVRSTRQNKRHGRKAIGPLSEDMANNGVPTAAYATALTAATIGFNLDVTHGSSRWRVGIPRSVKEPNPNAPPAEHYVIKDVFVMEAMPFAHISTQNSRKSF